MGEQDAKGVRKCGRRIEGRRGVGEDGWSVHFDLRGIFPRFETQHHPLRTKGVWQDRACRGDLANKLRMAFVETSITSITITCHLHEQTREIEPAKLGEHCTLHK